MQQAWGRDLDMAGLQLPKELRTGALIGGGQQQHGTSEMASGPECRLPESLGLMVLDQPFVHPDTRRLLLDRWRLFSLVLLCSSKPTLARVIVRGRLAPVSAHTGLWNNLRGLRASAR